MLMVSGLLSGVENNLNVWPGWPGGARKGVVGTGGKGRRNGYGNVPFHDFLSFLIFIKTSPPEDVRQLSKFRSRSLGLGFCDPNPFPYKLPRNSK